MAGGVNKVILVGHLGADPDIRYTPSGQGVCELRLATSESWNDKNGQRQERTEWHNVVAWERLAEIVGEYVAKGSRVYVEGKLQTSSWKDRESGEKKYRAEVVARDLVLLGGGRNNQPETDRRQHREEAFDSSEITDSDIPF